MSTHELMLAHEPTRKMVHGMSNVVKSCNAVSAIADDPKVALGGVVGVRVSGRKSMRFTAPPGMGLGHLVVVG